MSKQLPERPDLGQLKKQAKDLLEEIRAGRPEAIARANVTAGRKFALNDAQRVIAREYGFASWVKLKVFIETRTIDAAEERLVEAALAGEAEIVRTILSERPALATRSAFTSATLGDRAKVVAALQGHAEFAKSKGGPRNWEPILYLCFGKCGAGDTDRAEAARALLENGADPNASWIHPTWQESPLPALYGATGVNNYPKLARVLLEAGANPNDGESRYHAAEHNHVACLEVLAEFNTDFSGADNIWGNTPLYFLLGYIQPSPNVRAGIKWLLEHGANPNAMSHANDVAETSLHAAVNQNWDEATVESLLQHGADPAIKRADGRTAYAMAVAGGRDSLARVLLSHGAPREISAVDEFLGNCMRPDADAARDMVRGDPELLSNLSMKDRLIVILAAREGRAAALALMGELGFDLNISTNAGERPLHWAAWHGWADAVKTLIARGVELNARDKRFDAPPVGWCAHGSQFCANPKGEYGVVMQRLIDAGATVPKNTNGSAEVMAALKARGLG